MKRLLTLALLACSLSARAQQWYVMSDTNGNWLDPITLVRPGNSNQLSAWLTLAGFSDGGPTNGVSAAVATNIAAVQAQLATNFMWTNVTLYVGNFTNFPTAVITNLFFTNGTGQNLVVSNLTVLGTQTYNNAAFTNLNVLGYLNVAGATTNNGLAVFNNAVLLNGNANITGGLVVFGLTTLDNILNLSAQPIVQVSSIGFSGPIALTNALGGIGSGGLFADTNGNVFLSPMNAASPVLNFQPHFLGWGFTNVYGVGYLATWTNLGALVFGNSGWQMYQMSQVTPGDNVTLSLFDPTNSSVGANNAGGVTLAGKPKLNPIAGQVEIPSGVTGGSVPRILNNKLAEWISVKDFGAVGNGVHDDTAAIQNAINYAQTQAVNQMRVYFPGGTNVYLISSQLNVTNSGVSLIGDSLTSSIIECLTSGITNMIYVHNPSSRTYSVTIRGLYLESPGVTTPPNGVYFSNCSLCTIDDFTGQYLNNGVVIDGCEVMFSRNLSLNYNLAGVYQTTQDPNGFPYGNLWVQHFHFFQNTNDGFRVDGGIYKSTYRDGWVEGSTNLFHFLTRLTNNVEMDLVSIKDVNGQIIHSGNGVGGSFIRAEAVGGSNYFVMNNLSVEGCRVTTYGCSNSINFVMGINTNGSSAFNAVKIGSSLFLSATNNAVFSDTSLLNGTLNDVTGIASIAGSGLWYLRQGTNFSDLSVSNRASFWGGISATNVAENQRNYLDSILDSAGTMAINYQFHGLFEAESSGVFGWGASTALVSPDTGISRTGPTQVSVGNGNQGDASGSAVMANLYVTYGNISGAIRTHTTTVNGNYVALSTDSFVHEIASTNVFLTLPNTGSASQMIDVLYSPGGTNLTVSCTGGTLTYGNTYQGASVVLTTNILYRAQADATGTNWAVGGH